MENQKRVYHKRMIRVVEKGNEIVYPDVNSASKALYCSPTCLKFYLDGIVKTSCLAVPGRIIEPIEGGYPHAK